MFIRVDTDAYEGYQITGDEDIIFLHIKLILHQESHSVPKLTGIQLRRVTVKGNSSF